MYVSIHVHIYQMSSLVKLIKKVSQIGMHKRISQSERNVRTNTQSGADKYNGTSCTANEGQIYAARLVPTLLICASAKYLRMYIYKNRVSVKEFLHREK